MGIAAHPESPFAMGERRRSMWRSRWAAIGAAIAVALGGGGIFVANAASSPPSTVVTIDPVRILDTRDPLNVGLTGPFVSAVSRKLRVTGPVPTTTGTQTPVPIGATGVLLNVTVVSPSAAGFLSVRPGDASGAPGTSSLNFVAGDIVPNAVQVGLPTVGVNAGQIDITFDAFGVAGPRTDVLVDVVGFTTQVDAYTKAQTDTIVSVSRQETLATAAAQANAVVNASRQETIAAGGVSPSFVFPTAQLTLGPLTVVTTKTGHLEIDYVGSGSLGCSTDTTQRAWLEVDGVPVRSSATVFNDNFTGSSATGFFPLNLKGITATAVVAGSHQIRAMAACLSGSANQSTTASSNVVVTVLTGTPTVAALESVESKDSSDAQISCDVDAAGIETCIME